MAELPWPRVLDFLPLDDVLGRAQAASRELRSAGGVTFLACRAGVVDVSSRALTEPQLLALLQGCPLLKSFSSRTWYPGVVEWAPHNLTSLSINCADLEELPRPLRSSCVRLRKLDLSWNARLGQCALEELGGSELPDLEELWICGWRAWSRDAAVRVFNRFLEGRPNLQHVVASSVPLLGRLFRKDGHLHARVNLIDASLPQPLCLRCGLCGAVLYKKLSRYVKGPPTQPHIEFELFFDAAPEPADVAAVEGHPQRLNCRADCHNPRFLLAGPTSGINTRGFSWAAACGSGLVRVEVLETSGD